MASAFKCDICGALYELGSMPSPATGSTVFYLSKQVGYGSMDVLDLCPDCHEKFQAMAKNFIFMKERETK